MRLDRPANLELTHDNVKALELYQYLEDRIALPMNATEATQLTHEHEQKEHVTKELQSKTLLKCLKRKNQKNRKIYLNSPIQSRFGLYLIILLEHNDPPRCIISASRLVRAIDVTNRNRLRNVGRTRLLLRCVLFVMSSIARPMASDNFVEVCKIWKF